MSAKAVSESHIVQIVPSLPPIVGGVADYAVLVAREMATAGAPSRFLAMAGGDAVIDGAVDVVGRLRGSALSALLARHSPRVVVLHHSPYGYAPFGLCGWLAETLARWRAGAPERRLVVILHELAATGPVLSAAFWAGKVQRRVARRLVATADAVLTTSESTRATVEPWCAGAYLTASAVFSTVGEDDNPRPLSDRGQTAVVFGNRARRQRVYNYLTALGVEATVAFARAAIGRIVDIGEPLNGCPSVVAGLPVEAHGIVTAPSVAATLRYARVGIVDYPHHVVTKSTIVAAYLAHGMVCLNISEIGGLPAELALGREFVDWPTFRDGTYDAQCVADAGHRWYGGHTVATVSRSILAQLSP